MTGGQDHSGDAVRQLLAEIKQRADVASEGPWSAADEHGLLEGATPSWCVSRMRPGYKAMSETEGYLYDIAYTTGKAEEPDAEFIAASRQDVPRLVAALTAVLDLHQPQDSHTVAVVENASFGPDGEMRGDEREVEPDSFEEIVSRETNCMACQGYPEWPCATYRAVAAALEERP